jgi:S-adenosylmethionine:tRNA ribosyltransferase-isomerase
LPEGRIAQAPAERREDAKLLVVAAGGETEDLRFAAFPSLLRAGDVLVLNETRVIPARLRFRRAGGGRGEILLLRPADRTTFSYEARSWYALVRPARRLPPGTRLAFGEGAAATVDAVVDGGRRIVRFDPDVQLELLLAHAGELPLPPYVGAGDAARAARYQTVFARIPGSVAAPTASLHFTEGVLSTIAARGVEIVRLTLDVASDTFRPLSDGPIDAHRMHGERFDIPASTAAAANRAKAEGRRVVAAGTTVVRALEAAARGGRGVEAGSAETDLFITPGFSFRVVDALLTNFHLPQSTLLVLVAAFVGYDRMRAAYDAALARGYRFFSFGDAMFAERDESKPNGGGHG